jgi:hypothetical protein
LCDVPLFLWLRLPVREQQPSPSAEVDGKVRSFLLRQSGLDDFAGKHTQLLWVKTVLREKLRDEPQHRSSLTTSL